MAKTTFANIRHRARRAFFRLPRLVRYAMAAVVAAAVCLAAYGSVGMAYARRFPWLSSKTETFVMVRPTPMTPDQATVAAWGLRQVLASQDPGLDEALSVAFNSRSQRVEILQTEGNIALFLVNPAQIPTVFPEEWKHADVVVRGEPAVLLFRESLPKQQRVLWSWLMAMRLEALSRQNDGVFVRRFSEGGAIRPVFGTLTLSESQWRLIVSPSSRALRYPRFETVEVSGGLAGLIAARETASFLHAIAPEALSSLSPLWRDLAGFPGRLTLVKGTLAALQDPFDDSVEWQAEIKTDSALATSVVRRLLAQLTDVFPLAVERVLPDQSKVFELKKSESFFLSSGAGPTIDADTPGTLTFPHGQITYRHDEGTLRLAKGVGQDSVPMRSFPCSLSQPLLSAYADGSAMGTSLWKTVFLSININKIAICVDWNQPNVDKVE